MTTEIETATPAAGQPEQAQQVEVVSTDATTGQAQEQDDEAQETEAKKSPWYQKRIGELTRDKYESKRNADTQAHENAQLRDQLARMQQGEQFDEQPEDRQTQVNREAQRLNAEQSFNDTCNRVYAAGKAEFPNFDQAVANLQMVGVNRDFLEQVATSDASTKLIQHLGTDLDEAARISAMTPVHMARELTRLEYKLMQAPAPKPVSKAPAPVKPIGSGGSTDGGLRDDLSMDEWQRRRNKERHG
jgi:hypothetical protein